MIKNPLLFIGNIFNQKKYKNIIAQIKAQSFILETKTEEELKDIIEKIKRRVPTEGLNNVLPDWFAITQEISSRTINLKHFDTQLLAGIHLHEKKIVEMKTGEGKTLASTLAVSLNALSKKGAHVVTVNEYLAERDQQYMGKLYKGLGLTTGLILDNYTTSEKQEGYNSDITYVTNSQVVFDFLRDSSTYVRENIVQRPFNYCVIDEIDSILIDEARTPLIISENLEENNIRKLNEANNLISLLKETVHFVIDQKQRDVNLTEEGYQRAAQLVGKTTLYDLNDSYALEILNALKAHLVFKRDKDYIVLNNKVMIVDEFTGRVMEDRRWSQGIHEAIEMKEGVPIGNITKTKTGITYQNFFTLYPSLSGMSGTAITAKKEFQEIYNLNVVEIPTAKPMIRKDLNDYIYQTSDSKWKAVVNQTKECFTKGQPILIGTANVEKSELLSMILTREKIPHQVLNAKPENVTRESEIIALAGQRFGVTIATNMAGRGTDIILGGNPVFKVKNKLKELILEFQKGEISDQPLSNSKEEINELLRNLIVEYQEKKTLKNLEEDLQALPYSLDTGLTSLVKIYNSFYTNESKNWKKENKLVQEAGGLFVLGTERAETRRIDNQLRGRAGRQGDPGTSQFYVSVEDELLKNFGGDRIKTALTMLVEDKDSPLEGKMLTKSLEKAQEKVEAYYFDIRKNVFEYDEIVNEQRKKIFRIRNEFLWKENAGLDLLALNEALVDQFLILVEHKQIEEITSSLVNKEIGLDARSSKKEKELEKMLEFPRDYENWVGQFSHIKIDGTLDDAKKISEKIQKQTEEELLISNDLRTGQIKLSNDEIVTRMQSRRILEMIDTFWTDHLERMNYIRDGIGWRSYGQENPLHAYNAEAIKSYQAMYEEINLSMIYYFLKDPLLKS